MDVLLNISSGESFCFREESDSSCETRDSFSDSLSDESESEKLSRSWDGCSSEEGLFEQECLWPLNDRLGNLYFQYFERSAPYGRVPLMDKVAFFALCTVQIKLVSSLYNFVLSFPFDKIC